MTHCYYVYSPNPDQHQCYIADPADEGKFRFYDVNRRQSGWTSVTLAQLNPDGAETDFPFLNSGTPMFSERAWAALSPLLGDSVEALPVQGEQGEQMFVIHVLSVLTGVLDLDQSVLVKSPYLQRISRIDKHVLKDSLIGSTPMFKIEETQGLTVFVSDLFRQAVEEHGLIGLNLLDI